MTMAVRSVAHVLALACTATLAIAGVAAANSLTADVQVKVNLVTTSGVCGAIAGDPAVQVSCHPPGRGPVTVAGSVPYPGAIVAGDAGLGVAKERLPVNISSWRIVQLDNARYLELTIAW
jgi:hypothetical protein